MAFNISNQHNLLGWYKLLKHENNLMFFIEIIPNQNERFVNLGIMAFSYSFLRNQIKLKISNYECRSDIKAISNCYSFFPCKVFDYLVILLEFFH